MRTIKAGFTLIKGMEQKIEIWKNIPDYEGLYQVSNPGRIKSVPHLIKANEDGNKENNTVDNLEWCTNHENQIHVSKNGLLPSSKKVICVETGRIYQSSGEAERETGICGRNIRSACSGRYKTAGGYKWK